MKNIKKVWKTAFSLFLTLLLSGAIGAFNSKSAQAFDEVLKMQTIYTDNGEVNAVFNVYVDGKWYTEANEAYIYVNDMVTGDITKYPAEKINSENGVVTYKSVYHLSEGENIRIAFAVLVPLITGKPCELYDDNNGYWYQV